MALDASRMDQRLDWSATFVLILLWVLWLCFASTLNLPEWLRLSLIPVLLLSGALLWDVFQGACFLLGLSWVYFAFSVTPPGLFFLSAMIVFLFLRFATLQIAIQNTWHLLAFLMTASIVSGAVMKYWLM